MTRTDPNAHSTKGITCFMIPYEEHKENISFGEKETKMGWHASPTATVYFDNVRIHKRYMIGKENEGFKYAMMALDGGRINIAACSLGRLLCMCVCIWVFLNWLNRRSTSLFGGCNQVFIGR